MLRPRTTCWKQSGSVFRATVKKGDTAPLMTGSNSSPPKIPRPAAPVLDFRERSAALTGAPPQRESHLPRPSGAATEPAGAQALSTTSRPGAPPRPGSNPPPRKKLDSAPSSGFATKIDGATMADLVQLECLRGLTRAVRVRAAGESGVLYFDQGNLVHAETGQASGEEAALIILSWEEGTVEPSGKIWLKAPTIHVGWQGLLLLSAQRKDERKAEERQHLSPSLDLDLETEWNKKGTAPLKASRGDGENGVLRSVILDGDGVVLESDGELGDFADVVAYSVRLAQLIGEGLGLVDFQGMECTSSDKVMITYLEEGDIVAVELKAAGSLAAYRKKAGL